MKFIPSVIMAVAVFGISSQAQAYQQQRQQQNSRGTNTQGALYAAGGGTANATSGAAQAEDVDVGKIKERYWNKGDDTEVNVVQNRLYSKAHRLEVGLFGASVVTDPFLSVYGVGGSLGYHFTEYFALNVYGWKDLVSPSAAFTTLTNTTAATANTNNPFYFVGSEIQASVLYGKLSLVGKSIIYYDMHFLLGAGMTSTESGSYITPTIGLGQQIYLTDYLSLKLNIRLMPYKEDILDKGTIGQTGKVVDNRINWTDAVTLGLSFLL